MKLFSCPACGLIVFFGNVRCERCSADLGYDPISNAVLALRSEGDRLISTAGRHAGTTWRYCSNHVHDVCNWLLPADAPTDDGLCRACQHNLTIPDPSVPENVALWRKMEAAKHGLLYTLLRLQLPLYIRSRTEAAAAPPSPAPSSPAPSSPAPPSPAPSSPAPPSPTAAPGSAAKQALRAEARPDGLGFEFLRSDDPAHKVLTGHAGGLITIALAEADDAEREKRRTQLGEPYRTLLGHFRHEVGHWYWDQLVRDTRWREPFTALFGDASQDYAEALKRHYASAPRPGWQDELISAYAGSHPWEDFAETWAHYLHMIDTLETGGSFGIELSPRVDREHVLTTSLGFNAYDPAIDITTLTTAWVALSSALNSFNRSMGLADAYPFVLSPKVIEKLGFIHALVRDHRRA